MGDVAAVEDRPGAGGDEGEGVESSSSGEEWDMTLGLEACDLNDSPDPAASADEQRLGSGAGAAAVPRPRWGKKRARSKVQRSVEGQRLANVFLTEAELPPGVTRDDIVCISTQLGYVPPNLISVAARNRDGAPTVLLLYPVSAPVCTRRNKVELQPFPTIYWLCCPQLKADVSRLEVAGLVQEFEARLRASPEHLATIQRQHQAYSDKRWEMLSPEDRALVDKRGWADCLDGRVGIAGIRRHDTVKCLHAHFCHFLGTGSGDNIVGSWVQEALDKGLHQHKQPL